MSQQPFFHEASDSVRFWVEVQGAWVGASVRREVLRHRYGPGTQEDVPLETYQSHVQDIHAAVRRRVAQGSIEPVMLREFCLLAQ